MSDIVLRAENISKQYRLGVTGSGTLRDDFARSWAKLRGKEDPTLKIGQSNTLDTVEGKYVWALQDINFEVKQGEVLGIIGKNGAGKSTLLKILAKVTGPTTGQINIKGRIASLLEVGTGFHPELTGRENIYLNGAILGMTKREIKSKLDEIIDFAGVAKYIDTPTKRYSSGMTVRLAFAVAAHLEPEILIVDEVLAVGDAEFQKKAIGKMQDIAKGEGRTVLFVSHNMAAVQNLCTTGMLLNRGQIAMQGTAEEAVNSYIHFNDELHKIQVRYDLTKVERGRYAGFLTFKHAEFSQNPLPFGVPIQLKLGLKTHQKGFGEDLDFGIAIVNRNSQQLVHFSNRFTGLKMNHQSDEDEYVFEIENNLRPGTYSFILFLRSQNIIQDWLKGDVFLEIADGNPYHYSNTEEIKAAILPQISLNVLSYAKK